MGITTTTKKKSIDMPAGSISLIRLKTIFKKKRRWKKWCFILP
jgi:hypothetical protein